MALTDGTLAADLGVAGMQEEGHLHQQQQHHSCHHAQILKQHRPLQHAGTNQSRRPQNHYYLACMVLDDREGKSLHHRNHFHHHHPRHQSASFAEKFRTRVGGVAVEVSQAAAAVGQRLHHHCLTEDEPGQDAGEIDAGFALGVELGPQQPVELVAAAMIQKTAEEHTTQYRA